MLRGIWFILQFNLAFDQKIQLYKESAELVGRKYPGFDVPDIPSIIIPNSPVVGIC